jgi:hypothetical protein
MLYIIPYCDGISSDTFDENTISFLLSDLERPGSADSFRGHLLGGTATERFVTERLLPLLRTAEGPFLHNLGRVLRQAGSRHGRRYVADVVNIDAVK